MIITKPRGAIVTSPHRYAAEAVNLHYCQPLERHHHVDLLKPNGTRFARLCGDDRDQLAARAGRWRAHVSSKLTVSWLEP